VKLPEGGIPPKHHVVDTESFRPTFLGTDAVEYELDVSSEVLVGSEYLRVRFPFGAAIREKLGSEFGVVVGHDFVPIAHYLGVSIPDSVQGEKEKSNESKSTRGPGAADDRHGCDGSASAHDPQRHRR